MAVTRTSAAMSKQKLIETVVGTLEATRPHGEILGELAHDARNMMTALSLYCDLLEGPGVLAPSHRHYGSDLRLLSDASRHLVEKLSALNGAEGGRAAAASSLEHVSLQTACYPVARLNNETLSGGLIYNLREEMLAILDLLGAIAGPSITVTAAAEGGDRPILMSTENLIRALVNLVKNSSESIDGRGTIKLRLAERRDGTNGDVLALVLTLEDTGRGIPPDLLDKVFEPGFTTRGAEPPKGVWTTGHRGLGLSITRSILEAAGGRIHAENRTPSGARFIIELPVRGR